MKLREISLIFLAFLYIGCKSGEIKLADPFEKIQVETSHDALTQPVNDTTNNLYRLGNRYEYEYYYIRDNQQYLFSFTINPDTGRKEWGLVSRNSADKNTVAKLVLEITEGGRLNRALAYEVNQHLHGQTLIRYSYKAPDNRELSYEITGLVENDSIYFFHPPRFGYFKILELNPFPYYLGDSKKTDCWIWQLNAVSGPMFGDEKWKVWDDLIDINETYKNVGKYKRYCQGAGRSVWCTKIIAKAESALGETSLIAYFNNQLGFVELEYRNIDQSKLVLKLTEAPNQIE